MATSEQKSFYSLGRFLTLLGKPFTWLIHFLWGRWLLPSSAQSQDWVDDADWAKIQQEPLRSRTLLYGIFAVVILLITWAGFASIDEVARGQGKVIPSRHTQIIQSFDGGVVQEILVEEGQIVEKGTLLLRIDPTRFISSYRENRAQYLSLQAKAARLQSLTSDSVFELPESIHTEAPKVAQNEQTLYVSNLNELEQQLAIANQQLTQRQEELNEIIARLTQATRAFELASRELKVTRPLLGSGAISEVEILRLERDVSNAKGEREQAVAQQARTTSAVAEAESKLKEVDLIAKNQWRAELSETLAHLSTLTESSLGLADRVKYAEIYAPVRGTVHQLFVNTIGGVVQPGREVLEMTPLDDQLLIEVKIPPKDIAFLRPGQEAMVKLTAYDFTIYGGLHGVLEHIGTDTITDEKDETYYLVRIRTNDEGFDRSLPIIPGMTAQVDILTGKKTILSYLLKPILRAKQNALTER